MAERRMFAKTIIDSDAFLDMPLSTQALYFHLSMRADDDGFLNNAKKIMRTIGAAQNDYDLLVAKSFIIQFPDGICVIKHWRINNYLRSDRYKETIYKDEKSMLCIQENGRYSVLDTAGIPTVDHCETQDRLGKESIGKDRIDKDKESRKAPRVYFPLDDRLNSAFEEFVKMRRQIKAPMTDRAIDLAIKKLETLADNDNDTMIAILEQSTMNSWKGLFPLKEKSMSKKGDIDWDEIYQTFGSEDKL